MAARTCDRSGGNDVLTFSTGAAGANVHTYDFGFARGGLPIVGTFVLTPGGVVYQRLNVNAMELP